ncbi:hypothetical protein D047_3808A, partial [Vibrio parahaemolyticus VPTS-2010_2]
MIQHKHTAS